MIAWSWECIPVVALAVWFPPLYSSAHQSARPGARDRRRQLLRDGDVGPSALVGDAAQLCLEGPAVRDDRLHRASSGSVPKRWRRADAPDCFVSRRVSRGIWRQRRTKGGIRNWTTSRIRTGLRSWTQRGKKGSREFVIDDWIVAGARMRVEDRNGSCHFRERNPTRIPQRDASALARSRCRDLCGDVPKGVRIYFHCLATKRLVERALDRVRTRLNHFGLRPATSARLDLWVGKGRICIERHMFCVP